MSQAIAILSAARTPMGGMMGSLSSVPATELGAVAIRASVERAGLNPDQLDEVIMGCVLSAGLGQAPARQAALAAGISKATWGTGRDQAGRSGTDWAMRPGARQALAGQHAAETKLDVMGPIGQ